MKIAIMPEKITAEKFINNLVETFADTVPKKKSVSFFEEENKSVTSRFNRLFGRQKPIHHLLGGGKCMAGSPCFSAFVFNKSLLLWCSISHFHHESCSCRCSLMEEQEDLSWCFNWGNSHLGAL